MTRGLHLLIFMVRVKVQGHTLHIVVKPCKHYTEGIVSAMFVKLGTHTTYDKRTSPIAFKVRCQRSRSNLVNNIDPFYIANYNVISLLNSPVGRILQRWRCFCFFICTATLFIINIFKFSGTYLHQHNFNYR